MDSAGFTSQPLKNYCLGLVPTSVFAGGFLAERERGVHTMCPQRASSGYVRDYLAPRPRDFTNNREGIAVCSPRPHRVHVEFTPRPRPTGTAGKTASVNKALKAFEDKQYTITYQ